MNLSRQFHNVSFGKVVQIHTLEMNKHCPVLFARRLTTQYVSTVLLALRSEEDINVKIYLPKWYSDVDVGHFEDINNGRKNTT